MHVIKNKTQKIVSICIFLVFASLVTLVGYNQSSSPEKYPSFKLDENIRQAVITPTYNLTGGAGIYIDDSDSYNDWSTNVDSFDWISGTGTQGDPYEILDVLFDGEGRTMNLITIKNSNAHFRIENCILINTDDYDYDKSKCNAIYLENVKNGIISNVNTSECMNGIRQVNSNYSRIQGIFARNNRDSGITVSGGTNNKIRNNTISNGVGIKLGDATFNNDILENIITTGEYGEHGISLSASHYNNVSFNMISDHQESSGIYLSSSNYNNISGNTVHDSGIGFSMRYSDNNVISANFFVNSTDPWYSIDVFDPDYADFGFGLHIRDSSGNIISKNNVIDSHILGIYIEDSDNHSLWENTVTNSGFDDIHLINTLAINLALNKMNGSGLYFDIPYSGLADINIETSNLVNDKPIYLYVNQSGLGQADFINAGQIFLFDCNDAVISGLEFDFVTTGITLENCVNSIISSNEASDNSRWAFSLFGCNDSRIFNNDAIRSSIIIESSNYSKLIGNTVSYSKTDGISFENCHNNYISGNTASYSKIKGISLENCNNNYISGNIANYNNEIGIRLYKTNHGLIHNNVANSNNETGISVRGKDRTSDWDGSQYIWTSYNLINNTLTSNEANDNGEIGITIKEADGIIITDNTAKRNEDGIIVENFEFGIISENEVTTNKYGLTLISGSDIIVSNNTINSNSRSWGGSYEVGKGILIDSCQRVEFTDNVANGNALGLIITDCSACEVTYNHISENGEVVSFFLFPTIPPGDAGIRISGSSYINVTANILDGNGIGVSEGHSNILILNEITGFGYIIENSDNNIISRNIITDALIAIDLDASSYNNITFNVIIAQQCFRERNNCTSNVFEENDCTEVLPTFYLREIVSIIGLASVVGINIPLFLKKRKGRK